LATASSLSAFFTQPAAAFAKPSQQDAQRNLLIIHVDNLENDHPRLISVWSMFTITSEQTFITLKPLYPATVPDPALSELTSTFKLNAKKHPSSKFLKALHAFHLTWDGYLIIDDQGMLAMHQWLAGSVGASSIAQPLDNPELLIQQEVTLLNGICRGLSRAGSWPHKSTEWQSISPRHFITNLKMNNLMTHWHNLNQASQTPVCNVFSR
jgi:hypothetical protein